ncbi:bucentaur or craniofacial development-domain-containing protein [Dunaliella salina]|uniref:Bucentaur or craniofacial development-domain-containing protein n=1 Tax=Dunaliella salina TaxID=3046 RepID=A0ABQ7GGI1_DUNSA|nr:bucentaur or craniofacial development-domain-containing protein [Dunaliella salina]|eukprot:KAF5833702.1 bucentaur or craniofacial development-domain-containing protein [Dunaliella salina]
MATLLNADLPSDEEDDQDYEAAKDKTADAADRREFGGQSAGPSASKKRPRRSVPKFIEEEEQRGGEQLQGQQEEEEEEEDQLAAEDENDPRVKAKKAKIGQLWDLLNSKPGGAPAKPKAAAAPAKPQTAPAGPPTKSASLANSSLAALCRPAKPSKARNSDELWMRSLGLLPKGTAPPKQNATPQSTAPPSTASPTAGAAQPPATSGAQPEASPAPDQQQQQQQQQHQQQQQQQQGHGQPADPSSNTGGTTAAACSKRAQSPIDEEARAAAAAVTLQMDKNSKEAQKAAQRAAKPPPTSGLDAFLAEVEKKKKVNVLDKSKADWQQMKAGDATLEEELEAHRRSGGKFLDKQDFLKRAELREYEKERDQRLASDVRNRGRL